MKSIKLLLLLLCSQQLLWAQFSATMKNMMSGDERIYRVYHDRENYRYEFTEGGQEGVVIVKPLKNQTNILMPEKKYVHQTTCDDMMSRMNDPVQAAYWFRQAGEEKIEGKEKIENLLCEKRALYQGETKVFLVWHSEKLNFPVKIENLHSKNTHMNLVDVKSWEVEERLFIVPDDYTKVDDQMRPLIPEPPAPESWITKSVTIPFEGILKRGEKISMDISSSGHYKIKVRNEGDAPTKYIYHLYANGEKLSWEIVGNDSRRTHRIYMDEKRTFTYAWEEGWRLIVEGHEGEVMIEVFLEKSTIN